MTVNAAHACMRMRRNGNDHSDFQMRIIGIFTVIPVVIAGICMDIPKSGTLINVCNPLRAQTRTRRRHLSGKIYNFLLHGICKRGWFPKQTRRNGAPGGIGALPRKSNLDSLDMGPIASTTGNGAIFSPTKPADVIDMDPVPNIKIGCQVTRKRNFNSLNRIGFSGRRKLHSV